MNDNINMTQQYLGKVAETMLRGKIYCLKLTYKKKGQSSIIQLLFQEIRK